MRLVGPWRPHSPEQHARDCNLCVASSKVGTSSCAQGKEVGRLMKLPHYHRSVLHADRWRPLQGGDGYDAIHGGPCSPSSIRRCNGSHKFVHLLRGGDGSVVVWAPNRERRRQYILQVCSQIRELHHGFIRVSNSESQRRIM